MNIDYTVQIWKEDKQFIALALPLDVASCGDTPEEAREAVDEAVNLFLITTKEHGTLDEVLFECGYRKIANEWKCPEYMPLEFHSTALAV